MTLDLLARTRLEKAAVDNGFELERGSDGPWLAYASTHTDLRIWLTVDAAAAGGSGPGDGTAGHVAVSPFVMAMSSREVCDALAGWVPFSPERFRRAPSPPAAPRTYPALHHLVRRAFQLARALSDGPLKTFVERTADLPRATEVERLTVQRIGQDIFRDRLLDYWERLLRRDGPRCTRAAQRQPHHALR